MDIKHGLNKDTPLEFLDNHSICHAKNIMISKDATSILNEYAILEEYDLSEYGRCVGHIDCSSEIVLFFSKNVIVRYNVIDKTIISTVKDVWKYCGGDVFGTYTYNHKNELIIAISERNTINDVPLKIMNLNDLFSNIFDDDIYTLFPKVPIGNARVRSTSGGSMAIGTYTFFIRYSIDEKYKTNWFPIGNTVYLYDSSSIRNPNMMFNHIIQRKDAYTLENAEAANIRETIKLHDIYCQDNDKCHKHILLNIDIQKIKYYNTFELAYICTSHAGTNAFISRHYKMSEFTSKERSIINGQIDINGSEELYDIDTLTVDNINIKNINTICNYKNRLYIGDYNEIDRNELIKNINTNNIIIEVVYNETNNINILDIDNNIQPCFGPCTCYQFFLHYVWEDGSYSDGIIINDSSQAVDDINVDDNKLKLQKYFNNAGQPVYYLGAVVDFPIHFSFNNIPKVSGAVGCFISYANIEPSFIGEGLVFKYDESSVDIGKSETGTKCRVLYPEFNVVGGNTHITRMIPIRQIHNASVNIDKTKTVFYNTTAVDIKNTIIVNNSYIVPPDSTDNLGREGCVAVEIDEQQIYSLYTYYLVDYDKDIFKNKYNDKNKILISMGYIKLFNENNYINYDALYNATHFVTIGSVYGTNKKGYLINTSQSEPSFADTEGKDEFMFAYNKNHVYPCISQYPLVAKQLNIAPEIIYYNYVTYKESDTELPTTVYAGVGIDYRIASEKKSKLIVDSTEQIRNYIIHSANLNNLFKLDSSYHTYTKKIFQNYDPDKDKHNDYKTIRRSDVIASESNDISWRYFRPEGYKIITENKGIIKNIVGAGYYLLVHCEHSLFMFDINNVMKTADKYVQLSTPDVFEVDYKEVFTSEKGFGGISDNTSWIFTENGYIFFDNSAKKIYKFDNGRLNMINNNINNIINSNNHNNVEIGYDKSNDRYLFFFKQDDKCINCFSYNNIINDWISEHDFKDVKYAINTKDKLYFIDNKNSNKLVTYAFNKFNSINNDNVDSIIDLVFNDNFNRIKVLNFITYVLNKNKDDIFNKLQLKIYTDTCITDDIDLTKERSNIKEYKLPYYDYNRWNLNYFKNIADRIHNNGLVDRITGVINDNIIKTNKVSDALIVGKYFVVRIIFNHNNKLVLIKDVQTYFK